MQEVVCYYVCFFTLTVLVQLHRTDGDKEVRNAFDVVLGSFGKFFSFQLNGRIRIKGNMKTNTIAKKRNARSWSCTAQFGFLQIQTFQKRGFMKKKITS